MAKTSTLAELRTMLVYAEARAYDNDWMVRASGREDVRKLKARISRRERDQALRDIGMVKVRGSLGGTYWE